MTTTDYTFEITHKPSLLHGGDWQGTIAVQDRRMIFRIPCDATTWHDAHFVHVQDRVPSAIAEAIIADLVKTLGQCYDQARARAEERFAADLYDAGNSFVPR